MKTIFTLIAVIVMMNSCNGQTREPVIRPATQANRFYTGNPEELAQEVDSFLAQHQGSQQFSNLAALIVPHAGYYYSGNVAASAYMTINPKKTYKRIFLLGPSHSVWLDGASVNTEADYYATPLGNVKVDRETALKLTEDSVFTYHPDAHDNEHCLEVQLPFLQRLFTIHSSLFTKSFESSVPPIVPIIISTNDFKQLIHIADVLKPYLNDDNLFIISSDFSHYPSYDDAYEVDARTQRAIESGSVSHLIAAVEKNRRSGKRNLSTSACGQVPIITLLIMCNEQYDIRHLLYQNSGDISGERDRVVGYHSFAFLHPVSSATQQSDSTFTLTSEDKRILKDIALTSIRDSLDGKPVAAANYSLFLRPSGSKRAELERTNHYSLRQNCGAFVSLHKSGRLRGCIGHFGEDVPLYEIVAEMARAAAFQDPRFSPVTRDELNDLDIEISVLTPMRRIQSLDEFELHRHGIYIRKGYRSGTYLPQVADEVNWTKEEFVSHCSQDKAGLGWDGWKDAELYVYEAIVF